jgi:hypothetical protein
MMDTPDNEDAIKPAGIVRRFLARLVDINIELIAALFILGSVYIPNPITNAIAIFAGAMLIDFFTNYFFGNSLGKFLCALSVRKKGAKMQPRDWMRRTAGVWVEGFAFGAPGIYLLTMLWQMFRIRAGKPASYDATAGYEVVGRRMTKLEIGFLIAWGLFMVIAIMVFRILNK